MRDRTLYRNVNQRILGGVCSGLATRLGIPNWVVRSVFVIGIFSAFPIILTYFFLLYLIPPSTLNPDYAADQQAAKTSPGMQFIQKRIFILLFIVLVSFMLFFGFVIFLIYNVMTTFQV